MAYHFDLQCFIVSINVFLIWAFAVALDMFVDMTNPPSHGENM